MSKKVTLVSRKYQDGEYANQTLEFPAIGKQTFNKEQELEVDEDKVEILISLTRESFDFKVKGSKDPEPVVKSEKPKSDVLNKLKNRNKPKKEEIVALTEDEIELKTLLEEADTVTLLEMAGEAGMEPNKTAAMDDNKLRVALFNELKQTSEEVRE